MTFNPGKSNFNVAVKMSKVQAKFNLVITALVANFNHTLSLFVAVVVAAAGFVVDDDDDDVPVVSCCCCCS